MYTGMIKIFLNIIYSLVIMVNADIHLGVGTNLPDRNISIGAYYIYLDNPYLGFGAGVCYWKDRLFISGQLPGHVRSLVLQISPGALINLQSGQVKYAVEPAISWQRLIDKIIIATTMRLLVAQEEWYLIIAGGIGWKK